MRRPRAVEENRAPIMTGRRITARLSTVDLEPNAPGESIGSQVTLATSFNQLPARAFSHQHKRGGLNGRPWFHWLGPPPPSGSSGGVPRPEIPFVMKNAAIVATTPPTTMNVRRREN